MSQDVWGKLYDIATDDPEGVASIKPGEHAGEVVLVWPDGSATGLYWYDGDWRVAGELNTCPGDVAARDSL